MDPWKLSLESPQDLLTRTSGRSYMPRHPRESHKIDIEYLPERILQDPSNKRFPRELSHKHLQYRSRIFTQGPLRGFHQDLQKTFSQGPLQDLGQDLHVRTSTSTLWNSGQMVLSISLPGTLKISKNEHRATTRAIWHAQSDEMVAEAHIRISPILRASRKMKV